MKKKILSIALVLGILLSLLSSIPVSATAFPQSLSYAFFDYEDGVSNLEGATIVDGGISGSAKSLKYTSTATTYEDKLIYLGGSNEAVQGTIPLGATLKVSFYVKLSRALTAGNFELVVSGQNIAASVDATNTTDWQKVTFSKKAEEEWTITSMTLRFGSLSAGGNLATADSRSYYIDDMEISVSSPYNIAPGSTPMTLDDYTMDFENGSSIMMTKRSDSGDATHITTTEWSNDNYAKAQLIPDPLNASNTVMKIWFASNVDGEGWLNGSSAKGLIKFAESTASRSNPTGVVPPGSTLKITFRYYLPQAVKSTNEPTLCIGYLRSDSAGGKILGPVNDPYNVNRGTHPGPKPSTTPYQWHTIEMKWTNTTSGNSTITLNDLRLQGNPNWYYPAANKSWMLPDGSSSYAFGDRAMYFDDFRITIEAESSGDTMSLNDYDMDFEDGSSIQVNGANVTATETGTDEKAQLVADLVDGTNTALKVSLASAFAGSSSTMKFSNGTTAVETAKGKIPAGGKITYKFKYYLPQEMAANNPEFSVYHGTGAVYAKSATPFATTPNQWHNAELVYTNNTMTKLEIGAAQLRYCGGTAGTDWAAADSGAYSIYFDDFEVVTEGPKFPESSALAFTGKFVPGQNVVFSHTFTSSDGVAGDDSLVRVVYTEDGEKGSLGSCKIGETFTVPEIPAGGTLGFEVVPVDSTATLGSIATYTSAQVLGDYSVELTLSDISTTDGSTTANVTINNQRVDSVATKAILVVVLLDSNGAIVKSGYKAITCAAEATLTGTAGELKVTPDVAGDVVKATAYLWEYTGDAPSLSNTTMRELVADKTVPAE